MLHKRGHGPLAETSLTTEQPAGVVLGDAAAVLVHRHVVQVAPAVHSVHASFCPPCPACVHGVHVDHPPLHDSTYPSDPAAPAAGSPASTAYGSGWAWHPTSPCAGSRISQPVERTSRACRCRPRTHRPAFRAGIVAGRVATFSVEALERDAWRLGKARGASAQGAPC